MTKLNTDNMKENKEVLSSAKYKAMKAVIDAAQNVIDVAQILLLLQLKLNIKHYGLMLE